MRRLAIMVLLIVGTMVPGRGTVAFLTSSTVSAANTFTAGSVVLSGVPATALVTFSNMHPGAAVYGSLTVTNGGNNDLRYAVTASGTNADLKGLAAALTLEVGAGSTTNCTAAGFSSLTSVYSGPFAAIAPAELDVVGNTATLTSASNRPLAFAGTDPLCFKVTLPLNANTSLQGASTTVTLKFIGFQQSGF